MSNTRENGDEDLEPRTAPQRSPSMPTSIAPSVPEVSLLLTSVPWLNTKISKNDGSIANESFRRYLTTVPEKKNEDSDLYLEKNKTNRPVVHNTLDISTFEPRNNHIGYTKTPFYSSGEISAQQFHHYNSTETNVHPSTSHVEFSNCQSMTLHSDKTVQSKDQFENSRKQYVLHASTDRNRDFNHLRNQNFNSSLKSQKYCLGSNRKQDTSACRENVSVIHSGNSYEYHNAQTVSQRNMWEEIQKRKYRSSCLLSKVSVNHANKSFNSERSNDKTVVSQVSSEYCSKATCSPTRRVPVKDSEEVMQQDTSHIINENSVRNNSPSSKTVELFSHLRGTVTHPSVVDQFSLSEEQVKERRSLASPGQKSDSGVKNQFNLVSLASQEKISDLNVQNSEKRSGGEFEIGFSESSKNKLPIKYSDMEKKHSCTNLADLYKLVQLQNEQLQSLQTQVSRLLLYQGRNDSTCLQSVPKECCRRISNAINKRDNIYYPTIDESAQTVTEHFHCGREIHNSLRKCDGFHYPETFRSAEPTVEVNHHFKSIQNSVKKQMVDKSSQTMFEDAYKEIAVGTDPYPLVSVGVMTSVTDNRETVDFVLKTGKKHGMKGINEMKLNSQHSCTSNRQVKAIHGSDDCCCSLSDVNPVDETICFNTDDLPSVHQAYTPASSIHVDMHDYEEDTHSAQQSQCSIEGRAEQKESEELNRVGWTFYDQVVGQVNRLLGEPQLDVGERCENPQTQKNPTCIGGHGKGQEDYRRATVEQLRRMGISFHNPDINNCGVGTETKRTPQIDHVHYPQLPSVPLNAESSASDSSIRINALALKYLKHDQLGIPDDKMQDVTFYNVAMKATNFSVGTLRYLERYQLLPTHIIPQGDVGGVPQARELHNVPNVAKMAEYCNGCKCGDNRTVAHCQPVGSLGKILDITALKKQPKLL